MNDDLVVTGSLHLPRSEITERFSTSGGPGGQHANKVATRVEVRFDAARSPSLSDYQRNRITRHCGPIVRVVVDDARSQLRNRQIAEQRLVERLREALVVRRTRRASRPSRGSNERRLQAKSRRSRTKANRRKPRPDA